MKSPKYWRSLTELEGDPEFQEFVEREFRSPTEQKAPSAAGRRRFMQLMGASFALAGCRYKEEKVLPHSSRPDGAVPGVPQYYVSVMDVAGVATGLLVKSFDGRPIKIEGNTKDATTGGGTGTYHQAAILSLYDPDRSSTAMQGKTPSEAAAFQKALNEGFQAASAKGGSGFAILSRADSSPTLARLRSELLARAPQARWVSYEPTYASGPREGAKLAFGEDVAVQLHPEKADILVSLDSDLISSEVSGGLGHARKLASRRDADSGAMSRIYAFESHLSELGSLSDHRVAVKPSSMTAITAYIDAKVSEHKKIEGAQPTPTADAIGGAEAQKVLDVAIKDLLAHAGKGLVSVGSKHSAEAHALVHRINSILENVGSTVTYHEVSESLFGGADELAGLVAEIEGGKVQTLLILGGNPVYDAPSDVNFGAALAKVKASFHVGLYADETAEACSFHTPEAHFLEAWNDARSADGSVRLGQPLIEPLLGGRSAIEVLGSMLGGKNAEGQALVQKTHGLSGKAWRAAVHDGTVGEGAKVTEPELKSLSPVALSKAEGLEVIFSADPALFDGRFANNGWLQEMPHPLSKLCWGNAALVSPKTAKEVGLGDGHLCTVTIDGRSVTLPSLIAPGQADGTIGLSLGYGRTSAGVVGGSTKSQVKSVGANTYELRAAKAPHFATGTIKKSGPRQELAITQDLWAIDAIAKTGQAEREDVLVRETSLADYAAFKKQPHHAGEHHGAPHPGDVKGMVHHPALLSLWKPPVSYDGQKWGMAIDLNKCTGCSSCIIACQSENNTSVVGEREVAKGREMTWIRIERYYKGDQDAPAVRQQPVMCQQCENAPCEQVCPVGATMHSPEGLNDMVYNRCIGTRYCSNNCPYKVRRFNYRNYNLEVIGTTPYTGTDDKRAKLKSMAFNPEVTVRGRGVMEKCTFCVQRIQSTKILAKNDKRPIVDGDIQTACEQACPTGAIVFGDLNDPKSRVRSAQKLSRAYELLQELNNKPRVNYLARIQNPHPELATTDGHSDHH